MGFRTHNIASRYRFSPLDRSSSICACDLCTLLLLFTVEHYFVLMIKGPSERPWIICRARMRRIGSQMVIPYPEETGHPWNESYKNIIRALHHDLIIMGIMGMGLRARIRQR